MTNNWSRLYDAADRIRDLEPWNIFAVTDVAEIYTDEDEPYFVSISGMFEDPAVSVYRGQNGLVSFSAYVNLADEAPGYVRESKKRCIELTWGSRERLKKADLDLIRDIGKKYRGRDAWPMFRDHCPGWESWYISDDDAGTLAEVLEGLIRAYVTLMGERKFIDMDEGSRMLWQRSDESGEYRAALLAPVSKIEAVTEGCIITDEVLIHRLMKQPELTTVLELDTPYVPMPYGGSNGRERAAYPRVVIMAREEDETPITSFFINEGMDPRDAILSTVIEYIESNGRPEAMYVRDPLVYGIIGHLCMCADIELGLAASLPSVDACVKNMLIFMGSTLDD